LGGDLEDDRDLPPDNALTNDFAVDSNLDARPPSSEAMTNQQIERNSIKIMKTKVSPILEKRKLYLM
jgi:hypothetical protein